MLPPKSKEGPQEFGLYRMSISPKIYDQLGARSNIRLSPFKMSKSFKYDAAKGSLRYGIVNDLIGAMIIDSHQELKTAWKNLNTSKVPAAATQNFSKPPITEQQAMAYCSSLAVEYRATEPFDSAVVPVCPKKIYRCG